MIRYKRKLLMTSDATVVISWLNQNCHRDGTHIIKFKRSMHSFEILYSELVSKYELEVLEQEHSNGTGK